MSKQINDLTEITSLDNDSLFEVEKPELYGGNYSAKIRGSSLMASIVASSPVFNNLKEIYYTIPGKLYFSKTTTFYSRPHLNSSSSTTTFESLSDNNFVIAADVKNYHNNYGICAETISTDSNVYVYNAAYGSSGSFRKQTNLPSLTSGGAGVLDFYSNDENYLKFNLNSSTGYYETTPFALSTCNILLNVVCNFLLSVSNSTSSTYYNSDFRNWVALVQSSNNQVLHIEQIHELVKVTEHESVAQIKFSVPISIASTINFKLVTPLPIKEVDSSYLNGDSIWENSIFTKINRACLFYYKRSS